MVDGCGNIMKYLSPIPCVYALGQLMWQTHKQTYHLGMVYTTLYNPFMMILGVVYYWVYQFTILYFVGVF